MVLSIFAADLDPAVHSVLSFVQEKENVTMEGKCRQKVDSVSDGGEEDVLEGLKLRNVGRAFRV